MTHIIVVGNEKGGAGKSTMSMHIATALARMGHKIGALDIDMRQKTFARYLENRLTFCIKEEVELATPDYRDLPDIAEADIPEGENSFDYRLSMAVEGFDSSFDFILIDCPGSHTRLSQVAHALADTLVTPMNDSYIDFDLLARVNPETNAILGPSVYSEMVWNARQLRSKAGLKPIEWVVLRNRLGAQNMHNKKKIGEAMENLSKRIGFRLAPGFSERVIFRELFPRGLTLLDLKDIGVKNSLNISNVAARQELRDLIKSLNLPNVDVTF